MSEPTPLPDAVTRWAGAGLLAVGGLMLTVSGLCSLGMVAASLFDGSFLSALLPIAMSLAVCSAPPMLVGYLAVRRGLRAWRNPPARARGQSDEVQIFFGALLILVSIGGWVAWAMMWGLFHQEPGSDAFFYAVAFSSLGAFGAALVVMLGLNLILNARPQSRAPPS